MNLAVERTALRSPIEGVSDQAWTEFVHVMLTSSTRAVSDSNRLGAFEMMPRRLADLGVLTGDLRRTVSKKSKRVIWAATKLEDRDSANEFLRSLPFQMRIFAASMRDYASTIAAGTVKIPSDCTLSGALAICHRAGPNGLSGERFPETRELHRKANGIF